MTTHISLTEFEHLADMHGGTLDEWPDDHVAGARALLVQSLEARRYLSETRQLDDVLKQDAAVEPSSDLMARILADAASVDPIESHAPSSTDRPSLWSQIKAGLGLGDVGVIRPAGALMACLAIGFVAGASLETTAIAGDAIDVAIFVDGFGYVSDDDTLLEGLL